MSLTWEREPICLFVPGTLFLTRETPLSPAHIPRPSALSQSAEFNSLARLLGQLHLQVRVPHQTHVITIRSMDIHRMRCPSPLVLPWELLPCFSPLLVLGFGDVEGTGEQGQDLGRGLLRVVLIQHMLTPILIHQTSQAIALI